VCGVWTRVLERVTWVGAGGSEELQWWVQLEGGMCEERSGIVICKGKLGFQCEGL